MKILHTSDWHLGRMLYGRRRYQEFFSFLTWLDGSICQEKVDVLLVAGDVFDSTTPSIQAQELYYRFLCRVAASSCRHVVVTAGNHDSPSFLEAPRELLRALDVHVVGTTGDNPADQVLILRNRQGDPELIVGAVPYLRDRDVRAVEAGESIEDKERKLMEGIHRHYQAICQAAIAEQEKYGPHIPIIVMGHLFTAGGHTVDGDGVRELYVGSLAQVSSAIFPDMIDYLALGHLHVPQMVGGAENRRYSGSPLAMGFGEAGQEKSIVIVDFQDDPRERPGAKIRLLPVPQFQRLEGIRGDLQVLTARLQALIAQAVPVWLEIVYDGEELVADLRDQLEGLVSGSPIEILRIKNTRIMDRVLSRAHEDEQLIDLQDAEVFRRCLDAHCIPADQRPELLHTYREAVLMVSADESGGETEVTATGQAAVVAGNHPPLPGDPS